VERRDTRDPRPETFPHGKPELKFDDFALFKNSFATRNGKKKVENFHFDSCEQFRLMFRKSKRGVDDDDGVS
jgi:hypothetical protein